MNSNISFNSIRKWTTAITFALFSTYLIFALAVVTFRVISGRI